LTYPNLGFAANILFTYIIYKAQAMPKLMTLNLLIFNTGDMQLKPLFLQSLQIMTAILV